ncbi:Histidine--tRNA ligase, cytoplasmic [Aduncisulcus paluster]|uniref:histidine--tRNA ligase n=1 Tax=Aduncisulcus paluster TaxID=2918883 RepID=A0ABQ5K272_9EUKA|nr:Histidine--tRNA ligase, cytoplasmic [Aduncisulcus paluster]
MEGEDTIFSLAARETTSIALVAPINAALLAELLKSGVAQWGSLYVNSQRQEKPYKDSANAIFSFVDDSKICPAKKFTKIDAKGFILAYDSPAELSLAAEMLRKCARSEKAQEADKFGVQEKFSSFGKSQLIMAISALKAVEEDSKQRFILAYDSPAELSLAAEMLRKCARSEKAQEADKFGVQEKFSSFGKSQLIMAISALKAVEEDSKQRISLIEGAVFPEEEKKEDMSILGGDLTSLIYSSIESCKKTLIFELSEIFARLKSQADSVKEKMIKKIADKRVKIEALVASGKIKEEIAARQLAGLDVSKIRPLHLGRGNDLLFSYLSKLFEEGNSVSDLFFPSAKPYSKWIETTLQQTAIRRKPKCARGTRDYLPAQTCVREKALSLITSIFKKHGAQAIDTPVFELRDTLMSKYGEDQKLIYDLIDYGEEPLSLRYDLTVPFARFLAQHGITNLKRYHIAKVYRRDKPQMTKGRFREFYQCDLDISGVYDPMLPDAEVVSVVAEILKAIDVGKFTVRVNHRGLLDAIVDISGARDVTKDSEEDCELKFKTVCAAIDKLDKETWEDVREEMIHQRNIPAEAADIIGKLIHTSGSPMDVLKEVREDGRFDGHEGAQKALNDMELLFGYLKGLGTLCDVTFDLTLARGLDYYTGVVIEAVCLDKDVGVGSIAGGGRYDHLVGMFSGKDIPSVGASIGIERVFSILETKLAKARDKVRQETGGDAAAIAAATRKLGGVLGGVREKATDVFVSSIGGFLEERLAIVGELWKNEIPTEFVYSARPSIKKQIDAALECEAVLMVTIGESEVEKNVVKIKHFASREEIEVPRDQMIEKVREFLEL